MDFKETSEVKPAAVSKTMDCWKLADGRLSPAKVGVVIEREFPVYVNGALLATASLAPGMEQEFVAGYLFGQGFIDSIDDLTSLEIVNSAAQVVLKDNRQASPGAGKTSYRIVSGGGRSAYSGESAFCIIKSDIKIRKENIFRAMNTLFENAGLYGETEGVHAAGLFTATAEPLCLVEDIGRHNTLDKVVGYALLHKIDCAKTFLVSTGRMASEMVTKVCRCSIPVVATKTAVTDKGLEIGKKYGLTVIGFVRDTGTRINTDMDVRVVQEAGMKIYSGADRILCEL
jgi:FdhD protein